MEKETRMSAYKKIMENNKAYVFVVLIGAFLSSVITIATNINKIYVFAYEHFNPTKEEKIKVLTKKGCLLFKIDSSKVEESPVIKEGYESFWFKEDIYHAGKIIIAGHTYSNFSSEYALALGERYAESAAHYLKDGLSLQPEVEVEITSFGKEEGIGIAGEYECGAIVSVENK